jgi:hypothetical protein
MAGSTPAGVLVIPGPTGGPQQDGAALPARHAGSTGRAGSLRYVSLSRRAVGKLDAVLRWIHRVHEFGAEPECLLRASQGRAPASVLLAEGIYVLRGSEILDLHLWNEHLPRPPSRPIGLAWANTWRRQLTTSLSELASQLDSDPSLQGVVALRAHTALVRVDRLPKLLHVARAFGLEPVRSVGSERRQWRLSELFDALLLGLLAWAFNPAALRRNGLWRQQCDLWISRDALDARYGRSGADRKRPIRIVACGRSGTSDPISPAPWEFKSIPTSAHKDGSGGRRWNITSMQVR